MQHLMRCVVEAGSLAAIGCNPAYPRMNPASAADGSDVST